MTVKPIPMAVLYALAEQQYGSRAREWGLHLDTHYGLKVRP